MTGHGYLGFQCLLLKMPLHFISKITSVIYWSDVCPDVSLTFRRRCHWEAVVMVMMLKREVSVSTDLLNK